MIYDFELGRCDVNVFLECGDRKSGVKPPHSTEI